MTLPSVVSAVYIAQNRYFADSFLYLLSKEDCPTISINKSEIKVP